MDNIPSQVTKSITFNIAGYWFALPMASVLKIVNCPPADQGGIVDLGMVQLGSHTIQLLDLHRTFGLGRNAIRPTPTLFLLVLRNAQNELWGIALDAPPDLIDLPNTAVQSASTDARFTPKKPWISHIAILSEQDITRTLLLLDLQAIFQRETVAA